MSKTLLRLAQTFGLVSIIVVALHERGAHAVEVGGSATVRTVALSGQPAPGISPQVNFNIFNAPSINTSGQIAFHAFLQGSSVSTSNDEGIWGERINGLSLAVREFSFAPPPNASNPFRGIDAPFGLSDGELAFTGYLTTSLVAAPYITTTSGLQQVNGPGFPVPDANGGQLANYSWVGVGVTGGHSSNALLLGGTVRHRSGTSVQGYWLYMNGGTRLVVKQNDQPPGAVAGATFAYIGAAVVNASGQLAFQGDVSDSGFGAGKNVGGLWTNRSGSLQVLAHSGSTAAEFGAGVIYPGFERRRPSINDRSQILYHAYLEGPGITATNNQGLVVDDGGNRRAVVQRGQSAPGTRPDLVFDRLELGDAVINNRGQVAFGGWVTGPNVFSYSQYGIWLEDEPGELHAIARGGDPAPGGGFFLIDRQQPFVLNDRGQVAFASALTDNQGRGIWATDRNGVLQLVMRSGSQIEVVPGDIRTVSSLDFLQLEFDDESTGLHDGLKSGFNNRGEIAFVAQFQNGSSGVFVSSIVAVPEPPTLLIGVLASWLIMIQRLRCTCVRLQAATG